MPAEYDIVIVGAGMAGAAMACSLRQSGLKIAVVEQKAFAADGDETRFDPRVVALTRASAGFLEQLGVWPAIAAQRHCPFSAMHVWDAGGTGKIDFAACEVGETELGFIVENSRVTAALLAASEQAGFDWYCPASVSELALPDSDTEKTRLTLDNGEALSAALVIAADGAQSPLRGLAGLETREWSYHHRAVVTTVRTACSHQYTAWQRFSDSGPLAFLPLRDDSGDTHYSAIVWSMKESLADDIMALDDAAFCETLSGQFEHRLGEVLSADARFCFPLQQRHSKQYYRPGLVVVADAAHTIHPLAGQGINLGFDDVRVLAEEIDRAVHRQVPLNHVSILQRYQRRRMGKNLAMMAVMEGFKQLFEQQSLPLRWVRNEGMNQVNRLGLLKNRIMKEAMGI